MNSSPHHDLPYSPTSHSHDQPSGCPAPHARVPLKEVKREIEEKEVRREEKEERRGEKGEEK